MGCSSSKGDQGAGDGAEGSQAAGSPDRAKSFRDRRLSMSHLPVGNGRLSVYGSDGNLGGQPSEVQSPMPSVGCKTMGGFEPVPGGSTAKINQDRGVAIYPFTDMENCGMFGVYDGHGRAGEKVSEFVLQHLPAVLAAQGEALWSDVGGTLKSAYVQVDSDLANEMDASVSGTTAVTCLIKDNHCWLANSGDSRAIVMRKSANGLKAIDLTSDHKPDSPGEMKRILSMGGHITPVRCRPLPCRRARRRARATVPLRARTAATSARAAATSARAAATSARAAATSAAHMNGCAGTSCAGGRQRLARARLAQPAGARDGTLNRRPCGGDGWSDRRAGNH